MLLLDGVHVTSDERLRFERLEAPTRAELEILVQFVCPRANLGEDLMEL